ncbi:MAG TPA: NmrA/HSCARG family protein, partial [Anaerolineae bacterium]|nr:NmrA/HSCARG family protein [Anaerolineae bacterium]
ERVGWDVWAAAARANGLDEYGVATLLKMFQYYDEYGLQGGTGVLSWLLGRRPRGLRAYLETIKD